MKQDFRHGFLATVPIGLSIALFGLVCGTLSAQKGMTLYELMLMNVFVFGGPGQFVMVEMWESPLDVFGIALAALLINLRFFLMSATLHPLFTDTRLVEKMAYIHLMAEPNWALSLARLKNQPITPLFLFGGGICMLFAWSVGTVGGFFLGASLDNPALYGLDFALIAMIATLLPGMYRGTDDRLPWCVAGLSALLCAQWLPGSLPIFTGALLGALSALVVHRKEVDDD